MDTPLVIVESPANARAIARFLRDAFVGEAAIAWHLSEVLEPAVPMRTMVFHEITRQAIDNAVETSRDIDAGLVDAQEARRIVDRLFGYPVSEVLWREVLTGLSAGRVQ